jgi:hypothetical protein
MRLTLPPVLALLVWWTPFPAQAEDPAPAAPSGNLEQTLATPAQVDAMRQALAQERAARDLELSDTWMLHLDQQEHDMLDMYPAATALLGLGAVGWGLGAALDADGGASTGTYALAAASGATLGFAVASAAVSDPYLRRNVGRWGLMLQFAMLGGLAIANAEMDSCSHDCSVTLTTLGAGYLGWSLALGLGDLLFPSVYVSKHYADYRALPSAERAGYARDLMLRVDGLNEKRNIYYYILNMSLASGIAGGVAAADGNKAQLSLGIAAGTIAVTSTVIFIAGLLTRTPSERLMMGLGPSAP